MTESRYVELGGGINETTSSLRVSSHFLQSGINVEVRESGPGFRRLLGYTKFDSDAVPGDGQIRGVHYYNGKCQAFRDDGSDCKMYESTGSGWTLKHTFTGDAGGRYEAVNYAFSGTEMMYMVSGLHKAQQWDGTTMTAITSGMGTDNPTHIEARLQRLWISEGNQLGFSDVSSPTAWTELAALSGVLTMPQDVTSISRIEGGALLVTAANNISYIQGATAATITESDLLETGKSAGSREWSLQVLPGHGAVFLDDAGIMTLRATEAYGDFSSATVSQLIKDTVDENKNKVTASCLVRSKGQYRLFFNTGGGIVMTFVGSKLAGTTYLSWPDVVRCVANAEDSSGDELILFGSDDGYIYQMDSGNDFDGDDLTYTLTPVYTDLEIPRQRKRFKRAILDFDADASASISVTPRFQFTQGVTHPSNTVAITPGGGILGYGVLGTMILGEESIQEGKVDIPGNGDFITLQISGTAAEDPWEIFGIYYEFDIGKVRR